MFREVSPSASLMPVLILSALLFSTGCGEKRGVKIGDIAPAISGNDIHGNAVSLARLKGKVVVVYFWTNSCCGGSVAGLEPLYRRHKQKGLAVLAINEMDPQKDIESFAGKNHLTFQMLADEDAWLLARYQVLAFPTVFILDWNGVLREKILGNIESAQLEKVVLRQFEMQKKAKESYDEVHAR